MRNTWIARRTSSASSRVRVIVTPSSAEAATVDFPFSPRSLTGRRSLTRLYALCLLSVFFLATPATAATVKPYYWSPAQAAAAVRAETQLAYTEAGLDMDLAKITCRGQGKAIARKFVAFRCPTTYTRPGTLTRPAETKTVVVSVKMRKVGKGSICAAVGTVPLACLAKGARAKGSINAAYSAYRQKTQASPSDDECYAHGSGFYSCWFEDSTGRHTVTITFAPSPVVRVLS